MMKGTPVVRSEIAPTGSAASAPASRASGQTISPFTVPGKPNSVDPSDWWANRMPTA
ncbi:hypothetical protein D3C72_2365230 [compost metagenome]